MPAQLRPIGVISPDLGGYYFGAMINGIHQVTREAGLPLLVIQQAIGGQQLPTFGSDYVAGWLILHPTESDRANLARLCAGDAPVVTTPVPLDGIDCTLVQVDNRGGMRAAVLHLLDHGHRRIAYVDHGPQSWSQQRYLGYCEALAERGIIYDPALVIHMEDSRADGVDVHQERGEHAAHYLLEHGLGCTALAASTDTCAITAMQVLQHAGRRIPEDLAIVGFDDIVEAQYANPPLTTVRTQFDAIGRAAARQLLAELQGGPAGPGQVVSVPATILQRRSCGCTALDERLTGDVAGTDEPSGWQPALIRQLVEIVRYPLPLDPAVPPEQLWPGAAALVAAIDATLHGQQPHTAEIELAWQQAIAQTESLEALHAAMTLLEDGAEQRLSSMPHAAPRQTMAALLRRIRLELMRARLAYEVAPKQLLGEQVRTNYAVSMALLRSAADARSLGWLQHTPAIWGCLAILADAPASGAARLTIAGTYQREASSGAVLGQQMSTSAFPPIDQLPAAAQQGQELTILCPIRTPTRNWGVLALCGWRDEALTTGTQNLTIQAALLGATLDQNAVLGALTEQQATLNDSYQRERLLSQTVREIGCPIIPLLPGVLLVPLIGAIDSQRAQQIIGGVLEAIGQQRAHTVFLDVTGVPIVDTQVASSLIQTAQAATLLGARVVMVGIRPEIAQSIVGLGIDLRHLTMYSTLASALSMLQIRQNGAAAHSQALR